MELIFDIEADGLLDKVSKIHCMVIYTEGNFYKGSTEQDVINLCNEFSSGVWIGHNVVRYDFKAIEKLLGIPQPKEYIDTLALSWYLYPERNSHGLESWGEDFGIPKPEIDDWENLTPEEYLHRCTEDVKINLKLWELQKSKLRELYQP